MKKPTAELRPLEAGEREYVEQLYGRTEERVRKHCEAITKGNEEEAKDRFQETYTAMTESVSKKARDGKGYELDRSTETAYLKKIATNQLLNKTTRQPKEISAGEIAAMHEDGGESDESALERQAWRNSEGDLRAEQEAKEHIEEIQKTLKRVFGFLSEEERRIVVLRKIENESFGRIAAFIHKDAKYVQWAFNGAMSKLRYYGTLEKKATRRH